MFNPLVGPAPAYAETNNAPSGAVFDTAANRIVIDGTPVRVVMLGASGAFLILALRWAGFKFNVGVSS